MTRLVPFNTIGEYIAERGLLVAVDSDGSALDTMDVKYRQCFIPATIEHFGLNPVAHVATQVAEFVHLRSRYRGLDRFRALVLILDLLVDHPQARAAEFKPPTLGEFRDWLELDAQIDEPTLAAAAAQSSGQSARELNQVLQWSRAIDAATQARAGDTPPFAGVREALAHAASLADLVVISSAPTRVVQTEWRKQGIDGGVRMICGLESGPKSRLLRTLVEEHYGAGCVLMIGDSPGDRSAAADSSASFYPIIPGREVKSWQRLDQEILEQFATRGYTLKVQESLCEEFDHALPPTPPWQTAAQE